VLLAAPIILAALLCQEPLRTIPPGVTYRTDAQYTNEARRAHVNASAVVSVVVREDGTPGEVIVVRRAGFGLDEKAIESVAQWKFKPGTRNGQPTVMRAQIEVNWRLLDPLRQGQVFSLSFNGHPVPNC